MVKEEKEFWEKAQKVEMGFMPYTRPSQSKEEIFHEFYQLAKAHFTPKWIPVSEPPKEDPEKWPETILVAYDDGSVVCEHIEDYLKYGQMNHKVKATHWQLKPEPPKGG